jgi:hypothetical protein
MRATFPLIILLITFAACGELVSSQAQPPDGWVSYKTPTDEELRCANYAKRSWKVMLDGERLQIGLNTERLRQDPLPPQIRSRHVQAGSKTDRVVVRVNDGWIVGLDSGEFGGGLWWFSTDGQRSQKLSEDNVVALIDTHKGVLVLAGLSHMGFDDGKVLRVTSGSRSAKKLELLADLRFTPRAFAVESADSLIVLTTSPLVRVRMSGEVETLLAETDYRLLYPTSMTLSPSGVIHVGMRHFVTRLTPNGRTYREEWFVPQDCTRFSRRDYGCVCVP